MPVIYMDRASAESLTEKDIREIIDENLMDLKYGMLTDYYVGQHRILSETKKDSTAPNNRLVNNMAKRKTGYYHRSKHRDRTTDQPPYRCYAQRYQSQYRHQTVW